MVPKRYLGATEGLRGPGSGFYECNLEQQGDNACIRHRSGTSRTVCVLSFEGLRQYCSEHGARFLKMALNPNP